MGELSRSAPTGSKQRVTQTENDETGWEKPALQVNAVGYTGVSGSEDRGSWNGAPTGGMAPR